MPLLTDAEIAQLRSDIGDLLPDTCQVQRSGIVNVDGFPEETWGTAIVSTACRYDPDTSPMPDAVAGREAGIARYIVTMGYDVDLRDGDRIVYSGGTYEITALHTEHSLNGSVRAKVSMIQGD